MSVGRLAVQVHVCSYSSFTVCDYLVLYRSCYISEVPCFTDSARLALDRLTRLQFGDGYSVGPSPPTPAAPGDLVHQLIWEMDHVPLHLINQPPNVSNVDNNYQPSY